MRSPDYRHVTQIHTVFFIQVCRYAHHMLPLGPFLTALEFAYCSCLFGQEALVGTEK